MDIKSDSEDFLIPVLENGNAADDVTKYCVNLPFENHSNLYGASASPRDSFLLVNEVLNSEKEYGFRTTLKNTTENPAKSIPWTFSSLLNKIFCQCGKPVPITFEHKGNIPTESVIRAAVVSKRDSLTIQTGACHFEKEGIYFIKCKNRNTVYSQCPFTGELFLTFPIMNCEVEQTEYFTFSCFSSCFGINKRELQIKFSLDNNGVTLARSTKDLKVCACPGRDRIMSERKNDKQKPKQKPEKRKLEEISSQDTESPDTDSQEGEFYIAARHKEDYKILSRLSRNLMRSRKIPPSEMPTMGKMKLLEKSPSGGVQKFVISGKKTTIIEKSKPSLESKDKPK